MPDIPSRFHAKDYNVFALSHHAFRHHSDIYSMAIPVMGLGPLKNLFSNNKKKSDKKNMSD